MMTSNCVFCRIVAGMESCYKLYEDEGVMAFLDINPAVEGHTLVVPKKHVESLEEMDVEDFVSLCRGIKEVLNVLIPKLGADGYNLILNKGRVAGQEISHLHFHIFPRKKADGGIFTPKRIDLGEVYRKIIGP